MLIAYDWWRPSKFPLLNEAFLFSFVLSTVLAFLAIPYAKRRPKGTPVSWGEAMLAAVYVFGIMFLAFGIVPHHWIAHADADLGWTKSNIIYGPFDILKPKAVGRPLPVHGAVRGDPRHRRRDDPRLLLRPHHRPLEVVAEDAATPSRAPRSRPARYGRPLVKKG